MKSRESVWICPSWPVSHALPDLVWVGERPLNLKPGLLMLLVTGIPTLLVAAFGAGPAWWFLVLAHVEVALGLSMYQANAGGGEYRWVWPSARPVPKLNPAEPWVEVRSEWVAITRGSTFTEVPRMEGRDARIEDNFLVSGEVRASLDGIDVDALATAMERTRHRASEPDFQPRVSTSAGWQQPPAAGQRWADLEEYREDLASHLPTIVMRVTPPRQARRLSIGFSTTPTSRVLYTIGGMLWLAMIALMIENPRLLADWSQAHGGLHILAMFLLAVPFCLPVGLTAFAAAQREDSGEQSAVVAEPRVDDGPHLGLSGADLLIAGVSIVVERHRDDGRAIGVMKLAPKDRRLLWRADTQELVGGTQVVALPGLDIDAFRRAAESRGWSVVESPGATGHDRVE